MLSEKNKLTREVEQLKSRGASLLTEELDTENYRYLSFLGPKDRRYTRAWISDFMDLWFKKEEVLSFLTTQNIKHSNGEPQEPLGLKWIEFEKLKNKYQLTKFELMSLVEQGGLPAYYCTNKFRWVGDATPISAPIQEWPNGADWRPEKLVFMLEDVERLQLPETNQTKEVYSKLSPKESQELGRLRKEKEKWDDSIKAAVQAAIYCEKQGKKVTKKQIWDELSQHSLDNIPNTTFDKIWRAIPSEYRSIGGRPPKNK